MKTNLLITGLILTLILSSCASIEYLPGTDEIDVNQHGSYIKVKNTAKKMIKGELIAVERTALLVLTDSNQNKKIVVIPLDMISSYKLRYANPKNYTWTMPVFTVATVIPFPDPAAGGIMPFHGYFALFTAPFNFLVTAIITADATSKLQYTDQDMPYQKLKMFARYPQGLPPDIDIESIK